MNPSASRAASLRELAALFLKLGFASCGGPAVHIAMMENEVVRRRRWFKRDELLDLIGATGLAAVASRLIAGDPPSTQPPTTPISEAPCAPVGALSGASR